MKIKCRKCKVEMFDVWDEGDTCHWCEKCGRLRMKIDGNLEWKIPSDAIAELVAMLEKYLLCPDSRNLALYNAEARALVIKHTPSRSGLAPTGKKDHDGEGPSSAQLNS